MMEKLEALVKQAMMAADAIRGFSGEVRVISHYDADGIASAAIMSTALLRENKRFHLTLVNQLSDAVAKSLAESKAGFVVFLDMGSGQLEMIGQRLPLAQIIVIDHHQQEGRLDHGRMVQVNPMDFGIEENISGSGVTYIVARALSAGNRDLSGTAIVGAIGDSQIGSIGGEWGLFGLNREILKDAMDSGMIKVTKGLRIWGRHTRPIHKALEYSVDPFIPNVSGSESHSVQFLHEIGIQLKREDGEWRTLKDLSDEEQQRLASGIIAERVNGNHPNAEWIFGDLYELLDKEGECRDANEFATILNACGKMGKGFLGVELCMNVPRAYHDVRTVQEKYRKTIGDAVRWAYEQIRKNNEAVVKRTGSAWYMLAGSRISEHVISNVISIIEKSMNPGMPVFAFADAAEGVKVSARADGKLVAAGLNLKDLVSKAADRAGGQGGGHSGASGATIPAGSEPVFMAAIEEMLSGGDSTNKSLSDEKNINPDSQANNSGVSAEDANGTGSQEGRKEVVGKEVERKGLVQYFGS